MNAPFTPPETPVRERPRLFLVTLDDGRTGLVVDAEGRRFLRGIAHGIAGSALILVAIVAAIAVVRWAL